MTTTIPTRVHHYRVHLEPNLESFRCPGWVEIDCELQPQAAALTVHSADTTISACTVSAGGTPVECTTTYDDGRQELTAHWPAGALGTVERVTLRMVFESAINDKLEGLYRTSYRDGDRTAYMAVTQFEESDARRAFPCVDEPGAKATFDVEMVIDAAHTAIANTPITTHETQPDGRLLVRFERTPPMSTYLLFFGIGPFEFISEDWRGKPIRVAAAPGLAGYGQYAIARCREALEYFERYTGLPYPLAKMDLIAVADFAFGAMENFGAISYRENLVLLFPGKNTQADRERVAIITYHEVAHMWFGDIVSPATWKFIWLNESFASLFNYWVAEAYEPQWRYMDRFVHATDSGPMVRDALADSPALELPGDEVAMLTPSNAPIIYGKGAAVLQMIAAYLGEEPFRRSIARFLRNHQFGTANTADCWQAFDDELGTSVTTMMQGWLYQAGVPLIDAERRGATVHLRQRRFLAAGAVAGGTTGDSAAAPAGTATASAGTATASAGTATVSAGAATAAPTVIWSIPVTVRCVDAQGGTHDLRTLLDQQSADIDIPAGTQYYQVNFDKAGYYRVAYAPADDAAVTAGVFGPQTTADARSRYALLADRWALTLAGRHSPGDYLDYVEHNAADEREFLPLTGILGALMEIREVNDHYRDRAAALLARIAGANLQQIGFEPQPGEATTTTALRDSLLEALVTIGDKDVRGKLLSLFERYTAGEAIAPEMVAPAFHAAAGLGVVDFQALTARLEAAATPEPERLILLAALGRLGGLIGNTDDLPRVLAYALDRVPLKNVRVPIAAAARSRERAGLVWTWFTGEINRLATMHLFQFASIADSIIPMAGIDAAQAVEAFCAGIETAAATAFTSGHRASIAMSLQKAAVVRRLAQAT